MKKRDRYKKYRKSKKTKENMSVPPAQTTNESFMSEEDFWKEALSYKIQESKAGKSDNPETEDAESDEPEEYSLSKLSRGIVHGFDNQLFVTRNGIYLDVTGIDNTIVRQLCNKFMIKTKASFGNKWNIARGFSIIKRTVPTTPTKQLMLLLPRFGFLEFYFKTLTADINKTRKAEYAAMILLKKFRLCNLSNITNNINSYLPNPAIVAVGLVLESHQTKIIEYIISNHYNDQHKEFGFAGINLKLKTGAGKSYIAFGLIDKLKMPTLLIVHNQPQAEDMYQLAKKYFPNTSVGIYHSMAKKLGDIMIVVIHSACGAEEYKFGNQTFTIQAFYSRYGFAIFDESHKYCSPEFSKVFSRCQVTYMLGLSATPGERQDGFDPLTYWNLGPLIDIKEKIPNLLNDEPFITKILGIKYLGSPDFTVYRSTEAGMFDYDGTLTQMMEDPHRLQMIIPLLEYLHDQKRNVYIFSDRLEYLSVLRRAFFASLRQKKKLRAVDTLDDDVIEFMKSKPTYEVYIKELQVSINNKLQNDFTRIQTELGDPNRRADPNKWYCKMIGGNLLELANREVARLTAYYNDILKEESTVEYYEQLLETYKKNYIDDHIESKSTLSILTGGAKGEQINSSAANATMIFTTYGYMGTGKSIPKMDTVLLLTPRRNGVEQVVGRIFRPGPNKNTRWIIDLIDWKINLKSQWYERLNVYNRQAEQNRSPTISEVEFVFDKIDDTSIIQKMNEIFTDVNTPCVENSNTLSFDFSKITIAAPTEPKRKVRIIKKF